MRFLWPHKTDGKKGGSFLSSTRGFYGRCFFVPPRVLFARVVPLAALEFLHGAVGDLVREQGP